MDETQYNEELDKLLSDFASEEDIADKFKTAEEIEKAPPAVDPEEGDDPEPPKELTATDLAAAQEAMARKLDVIGGYVFQQQQQREQPKPQPQYQPAPPPVQPSQPAEPYLVTNQDLAPVYDQLNSVMRIQAQNIWNQEATNFRQAEANLRTRFPDFDNVVPQHEREKAFDQMSKAGQFGQNWQARFEYVYKAFAYDKVAARADELTQKRESKRAATTKAAAVVPPSGAVFQQPEVKLDRSKRGWSDARNATVEALRAL